MGVSTLLGQNAILFSRIFWEKSWKDKHLKFYLGIKVIVLMHELIFSRATFEGGGGVNKWRRVCEELCHLRNFSCQ